jgi:uncharacterized protein YrrD
VSNLSVIYYKSWFHANASLNVVEIESVGVTVMVAVSTASIVTEGKSSTANNDSSMALTNSIRAPLRPMQLGTSTSSSVSRKTSPPQKQPP